jgi:hypothetical protein
MPIKLYLRGKVWHYRGTVAKRRLRGSCQTTNKDIASRQIAEIETKHWKHRLIPQAVLTFSQAALMYPAAGKPTRFLPQEDYWRDALIKDISPGNPEDGYRLYPKPWGRPATAKLSFPSGCHQSCCDSEACISRSRDLDEKRR